MKKKLMICFATASLLVGGVFATRAVVEKNRNPWIGANLEALSQSEGYLGPMCSKTRTPGTFYMKDCDHCDSPFGYYAMDIVAYCWIKY